MDQIDQNAQPNEQESQPISYSTVLAACVYGTDGKCKGMLTPERLQILRQKYNEAKSTGLHHNVSPPLQSFASELVGLFVRKAIPEAKWSTTRVSNDAHIRMPPLGAPPPGFNKLERLKPDHLLVAKRHNRDTSLHPGQTTTTQIQDKSSPHLALKVADWKKIAYTGGSCICRDHQQIIGAGVYIPDTNRIHHVNPNGSNITNTVHRAELAGIAAAVTHDYFLIATDSENFMRQIRKQIRYPELHTYHIHHNLLETIIKAIRNTATLSIKFLKVKAHTGIIGNERADQIAKHAAKHPEVADTGIKMAGHEGNPFHNIIWLATSTDDPNIHPIIDNDNQSQPYQPHMRYLPNKRDALQAHMHKVHKLGNSQTDTSYYTYYQNQE